MSIFYLRNVWKLAHVRYFLTRLKCDQYDIASNATFVRLLLSYQWPKFLEISALLINGGSIKRKRQIEQGKNEHLYQKQAEKMFEFCIDLAEKIFAVFSLSFLLAYGFWHFSSCNGASIKNGRLSEDETSQPAAAQQQSPATKKSKNDSNASASPIPREPFDLAQMKVYGIKIILFPF